MRERFYRTGLCWKCEDMIKARVSGYGLTINNLGTDAFSYTCDERCQDWLYHVKRVNISPFKIRQLHIDKGKKRRGCEISVENVY